MRVLFLFYGGTECMTCRKYFYLGTADWIEVMNGRQMVDGVLAANKWVDTRNKKRFESYLQAGYKGIW